MFGRMHLMLFYLEDRLLFKLHLYPIFATINCLVGKVSPTTGSCSLLVSEDSIE
jgi:hypothetical protein